MAARTGKSAKRVDDQILFGKKLKNYSFKPLYWLLLSLFYLGQAPLFLLRLLFSVFRLPASIFLSLSEIRSIRLIRSIRSIRSIRNSLFSLFSHLSLPKLHLPQISLPQISFKIHLNRKIIIFSSSLLLIFFVFFEFYLQILKDLPHPDRLITRDQIVSTKIYDQNGQLLYKIYRNQNRTLVNLDQIPLSLRQATVAIEDADFYNHRGFALKSILRASYNTIIKGHPQGGSTITQQLVKSALLTPEKTLRRKIRELILSLQVETYFSKDEILQMYFNEVGYGGAAYGAEEASQMYFGKPVSQLNLAESALLAGLPAAPTQYSPFGSQPQLAKERQKEVLRRMVEVGYLSQPQKEEALSQKLVFKKPKTDIRAPHFVMYVKDLLVREFGEKMVEEGGLAVTTSLDLDTQKMAEKIVREEISQLKNYRVGNAASLIIKPQTGAILAMVGSKDYFNLEEDGNVNVTLSLRQPGSSIKIINYAYALSHGYTAATILSDTPVTYKTAGSPAYSPVNYDGRFHGSVSLRTALASSYNVPAVKVLASYGVDKMIAQGQQMGITTWNDTSRFGLSLTLGGAEVKMTDLATAYGVLANQGQKVDLQPILEVKNYQGKILQTNDQRLKTNDQTPGETVVSPAVAYLLTDILSDNQARTPAFGPNSVLNLPGFKVAVKTGTTTNLRDNWTIGYTPDFLTAVWVGNNDNSPMSQIASGITGASPIWQKIMLQLLQKNPQNTAFTEPPGLKKVAICLFNGLLSCEGCPSKEEYFLSGTEPQYHCDSEKMKRDAEEKQKQKEAQDKILTGESTRRQPPLPPSVTLFNLQSF